ncbi:MAG: hypothetical protein WCV55_00820 [Candidatus Paceibacterota bacterium]
MSEKFPQNNSEISEEQEQTPAHFDQQPPVEEGIPNVERAGRLSPEEEEELRDILKQYKK